MQSRFWGVRAALSHLSTFSCAQGPGRTSPGSSCPSSCRNTPPPRGRRELPRPPAEGGNSPQFTEAPDLRAVRQPSPSPPSITLSLKWGPRTRGGHTGAEAPPGGAPQPGAPHRTPYCEASVRERSVGPHWLATEPMPPSPTTERAGCEPAQPPRPELTTGPGEGPPAAGPGGAPGLCCQDVWSCHVQPGGTGDRAARFSSLEAALWPATPGPPRAPPRGPDPQPEARPPRLLRPQGALAAPRRAPPRPPARPLETTRAPGVSVPRALALTLAALLCWGRAEGTGGHGRARPALTGTRPQGPVPGARQLGSSGTH